MKKNNKGFMLTELMVVSVAILVLFIAVYSNFYPNIGEYENRLYYNNIDTEYALFYTRVMYLKYLKANTTTKNNLLTNVSNNNYVTLIENGTQNIDKVLNIAKDSLGLDLKSLLAGFATKSIIDNNKINK